VTDDAETLVALDEEARDVAGDRSDDEPRNDAHEMTLLPVPWPPRESLSGGLDIHAAINRRSASTT